jgi:hypothetical protein
MHQLTSDPSPGAAGLRLEVTVEDDAIGLAQVILEFKYGFDSQTRGTGENRRTIRTISDARYEPLGELRAHVRRIHEAELARVLGATGGTRPMLILHWPRMRTALLGVGSTRDR